VDAEEAPVGVTSPSGLTIAGRRAGAVALALLPVALWCLTQRYRGLIGDAELYSLQALSRIDTSLSRDVFLSSASQDRFTVFSPLYAAVIRILGLRAAALSLLLLFKLCFYGSAWAVARRFSDTRMALLATALLIAAPNEYGAYHVFRVSENMLTARTAAEALSMAGLCFYVYGRRGLAIAVTAFALLVHALMALPMLLLLLTARAGVRARIWCALTLVLLILCAASVAAFMPRWAPGFLSVMDASWVEMVRERSQFVFLQLWRTEDWATNIRPLISLMLSLLVLRESRITAVLAGALIVGSAGLAIAFIASGIGPVAILLQGQAWRWVWVPATIGLLVLAPAVSRLWREDECGRLCAVLLLGSFMVSIDESVFCAGGALSLWLARRHITVRAAPYLRGVAIALGTLVLGHVAISGFWSLHPRASGGSAGGLLHDAHALLELDGMPFLLAFLGGCLILRNRSLTVRTFAAVALGVAILLAAPSALVDSHAEGSSGQIKEFSDWRRAIPPGENVFVTSAYYSAAFIWFTLQRPSYLTVDQSSGVIFSRATAMEIRRRSEILLPLEQPSWRLMSNRASQRGKFDPHLAPLTRDRLIQICRDATLNFVVAREDVGFEPLPHRSSDAWNGWNLYNCRRVSSRKDLK
jgi:hypothetical protein